MALKAEIHSNLPDKIRKTSSNFWAMSLIFAVLMLILRGVETFLIFQNHVLPITFRQVAFQSFLADINWILYLLGLLLIVHIILSILSVSLAKWVTEFFLIVALLAQLILIFYFLNTLNPLGKDLLGYNLEDMKTTIQASGQLNLVSILGGCLGIALLILILNLGIKYFNFEIKTSAILTICMYWFLIIFYFLPIKETDNTNELKANIQFNKSNYLAQQVFDYYRYKNEFYFDFYLRSVDDDLLVKKNFIDPNYPFLHTADYPDVLSPFFDSLSRKPDLVFIFVESLGKAYSGKNALLGSFTPYLDSLEKHSLVWTNAISSTGRTFGLLPGIFGGLPFGENGFLEMYADFPNHNSLLSVLETNGYESHFFVGTDKAFDHEDSFLEFQKVKTIDDLHTFDPKYPRISSETGFSWGYNDKELFSNALEKFPQSSENPQIRIFQTITSHNPYRVPNPDEYKEKFDAHLDRVLHASDTERKEYESYKDIYYTILYADDAIRNFITSYKKRPEFENTIFIITGDHRLPEIPMASRLDRFHVPLIIYSPLLSRPTYFKGMTSHFEVTPTLLSFLHGQTDIDLPEEKIWQGQVMDTSQVFRSMIAMPLMRNKNQLADYLNGTYFLSDDQVFVISDGLNIDLVEDQLLKNRLTGEFQEFINKNNYTFQTRKLLPVN